MNALLSAVLIPLNSGRDTDADAIIALVGTKGLNPFEFRA